MFKEDDDDNDDGNTGQTRYPVMPSLVALQQMKNRLALGYLGKKLMKWTAMATNKELRKLAQIVVDTYKTYRTDMMEAFMLLARARYFYPNMNGMVLENVSKPACLVRLENRTITGVKVVDMILVEKDFDPNAHLGIGAGGEAITKAKKEWRKLLKTMVLMAELRSAFKCLDEANRNATKKQNVLGKLIIPRIVLSIDYIKSELEEQEREETFRLKRFKQSKEKKLRKDTAYNQKEIKLEKVKVPLAPGIRKEIVPVESEEPKEILALEPNIIEKSQSDIIDETDIQKFKEMFRTLRLKLLDKDNKEERKNQVDLCSCILSKPVYDSTTGKLICPICELPTGKQHSCEDIKMDIVPCTNYLPEDIGSDQFFNNLMSRVEEVINKTTQHTDDCQCDTELPPKIRDECPCPADAIGERKDKDCVVKLEIADDGCACEPEEKIDPYNIQLANILSEMNARIARLSEPHVRRPKCDYPGFRSDTALRIAKASEPYMRKIQTKKLLSDPFRAFEHEMASKIAKASAPYLMQYRRHSFPKDKSAYSAVASEQEESRKLCISSLTDLSNISYVETYVTMVAHHTTSAPNSLEENSESCICQSTTTSKPKSTTQKDSSTYVTVVQRYKVKQPSQGISGKFISKNENTDATSHDARTPQVVRICSSALTPKNSVGCVIIPQGDASFEPYSQQISKRSDGNINSGPSSVQGYVLDCPKEDTTKVPNKLTNSAYLMFICSGGNCCKPDKQKAASDVCDVSKNILNSCTAFKMVSNSNERQGPSHMSEAATNTVFHEIINNSNGCVIGFPKSHTTSGQSRQENNPETYIIAESTDNTNQFEETIPNSNGHDIAFPQSYTTGVVNTQENIPNFIKIVTETTSNLKNTGGKDPTTAIKISFLPEKSTCCGNFGKEGRIGISASLKIEAVFSTQNLNFNDINEECSQMSYELTNRQGIAGICGVNKQSFVLSCAESCGCDTKPGLEPQLGSLGENPESFGFQSTLPAPEPYTREGKPGACSFTVQSAQTISPGRPISYGVQSSASFPEAFTREGKPGPFGVQTTRSAPEPGTEEGKSGQCGANEQSNKTISAGRPIPETWPCDIQSSKRPSPEPYTREGKPGPFGVAEQSTSVLVSKTSAPVPYTREGRPGPSDVCEQSPPTISSGPDTNPCGGQSSKGSAPEPYTREGKPGPCSVGEQSSPAVFSGHDSKPRGGQSSKKSAPEPYTREGRPGPCNVGEQASTTISPGPDNKPCGGQSSKKSAPEPYTREGRPGPCNIGEESSPNESSGPDTQEKIVSNTREERPGTCGNNKQTSTKISSNPYAQESKPRPCDIPDQLISNSKDTAALKPNIPTPNTRQDIPGLCGVESMTTKKANTVFDAHNSMSPHYIIYHSASSNQGSFTPLVPKVQVKITKSSKTLQNIHPENSSQNVNIYIRCNPPGSNNSSSPKSLDNADLIETNIEENVKVTTSMFQNPDGTVIKEKEIITTRIEKQVLKMGQKNADDVCQSRQYCTPELCPVLDIQVSDAEPCGINKPCPDKEKPPKFTASPACDNKSSDTDSEPVYANRLDNTASGSKCDCSNKPPSKPSGLVCANRLSETNSGPKCTCGDKPSAKTPGPVCANRLEDTDSGPKCDCGEKAPAISSNLVCANRQSDTDSGPKCNCGQKTPSKTTDPVCANRLEDTDSGPKCDCGDKTSAKSSEPVCANRLEDTDSGPKCNCGEKALGNTAGPVCANRLEDTDSGAKCDCGEKALGNTAGPVCANRLEDTDSGPKCTCGEKTPDKAADPVCANRLQDTDSGPKCNCGNKSATGANTRPRLSNPIPSKLPHIKTRQNVTTSITRLPKITCYDQSEISKQSSESTRKFDVKCNICNHSKCSCTSQSQCSNEHDYLPIVIRSVSKSKKKKEPEHYTIRIITKKSPNARDRDASDSSLINNVISALRRVVLRKSREMKGTKITNKNICQTCYSTTTSESSKSACKSDIGSEKYYRCTNYGTESESNKTLDTCQRRNISKKEPETNCSENPRSVLSKICNERSKEFWTAYRELNKAIKSYKDAATSTKLCDRNDTRLVRKGTIRRACSEHSRDSWSDAGSRKCLKRSRSH